MFLGYVLESVIQQFPNWQAYVCTANTHYYILHTAALHVGNVWVLGRICLAKNDVHTGALDTKQAAMASLATLSGVCSLLCRMSTHLQPAEPSDSALAPSRAGTQDCTAFKGFYSSMAFKFGTAPWPLVQP